MADYRTSIDYAQNYGVNDPLYEMLRRRLREQIQGNVYAQQQQAMAGLESRGVSQGSAAAGTYGAIAAGGLRGLGEGAGQIAQQQAQERFQLLRDAIGAERDKPSFWSALPSVLGGAGALLGAPAAGAGATLLSQLLKKKRKGEDEGGGTPNGAEDQGYWGSPEQYWGM